jgi:xylan 1,4-beta-xylosidase
VLAWNLTLDQSKAAGSAPHDRSVTVRVAGLAPGTTYTVTHERVDADHSNIAGTWAALRDGDQPWPDGTQWETLRKADRLETLEDPRPVTADDDGAAEVTFDLPMPGMSFLRFEG